MAAVRPEGRLEMPPSATFSRRSPAARLLVVLALCALQPPLTARAASPSTGTITAAGPALSWTGTATGSRSANVSTCVDGVNCDTFTLTLGGTTADYRAAIVGVQKIASASACQVDRSPPNSNRSTQMK